LPNLTEPNSPLHSHTWPIALTRGADVSGYFSHQQGVPDIS